MSDGHEIQVPPVYNGINLTGLSDKQIQFCEAYSQNLVVKFAAHESGYSERQASRLLRRPDINAYLHFLADNRRFGTILTKNELLEGLSSIARGDAKEEVVTPDGRMVLKSGSLKDRVKAYEIIAKAQGYFDKVEDINQATVIDIGFANEVEPSYIEAESKVID